MELFGYLYINQSQICIGKMIFLQNALVIESSCGLNNFPHRGFYRMEKDFLKFTL